jgi:DNA-binding beta-propeller fold protein YncE
MRFLVLLGCVITPGLPSRLDAQRSGLDATCGQPLPQASTLITLQGSAFQALPSRDGCWIFVGITAPDTGKPGIALFRRRAGTVSLFRFAPLETPPTGMVLTHDGKLLIAAAAARIAFVDVERLIAGSASAVSGYLIEEGLLPGRIYANVTADDRTLFVSDERAQTITVIDLPKARRSQFAATAIVGKIPVGNAPIDLAFSPDERYLYSTSQAMLAGSGWPLACRPEGSPPDTPPNHRKGAIIVVDVARARTDPARSVVATIAAGCNPVRLVLSPRGDVAYVSARGLDALMAFDTRKLLADSAHALIGQVPVGTAPVGVAVFDSGRRVIVTSSNRFAGNANDRQPLFVIDAGKVARGAAAVVGTIAAGAFPREMRVTADGRTLVLTNFGSRTLQLIDLTRLPLVARTP